MTAMITLTDVIDVIFFNDSKIGVVDVINV